MVLCTEKLADTRASLAIRGSRPALLLALRLFWERLRSLGAPGFSDLARWSGRGCTDWL